MATVVIRDKTIRVADGHEGTIDSISPPTARHDSACWRKSDFCCGRFCDGSFGFRDHRSY